MHKIIHETKFNQFLRQNKSLSLLIGVMLFFAVGVIATSVITENNVQSPTGTFDNISADRINSVLYVQAGNGSDIQATIDKCPINGCKIIIPCGNYNIDTDIQIKSNISLIGNGECSIINGSNPTGNSNDALLELETNAIKISIGNLKLIGDGKGSGIYGINNSYITISDIITKEAGNHSEIFLVRNGEDILVTRNNLVCPDNSHRGVYIDGAFSNVIVSDNFIQNCNKGIEYDKLTTLGFLQFVKDSIISGNIIQGGDLHGIFIEGSQRIVIDGNVIYNQGGSDTGGISVSGGDENGINFNPQDIVITNNIISNTLGGSVKLSRTNNIIFSNNKIVNTSASGLAINIANASNIQVINNNIENSTSRAIYLQSGVLENIIIKNNRINSAVEGVFIESTAIPINLIIESNIINNATNHGVFARASTKLSILGNIINNTGTNDCVKVQTSEEVIIKNNIVDNCGINGFRFTDLNKTFYHSNILNSESESLTRVLYNDFKLYSNANFTGNVTIEANSVLTLLQNSTPILCGASVNNGSFMYDGNFHYGCNGTGWNPLY